MLNCLLEVLESGIRVGISLRWRKIGTNPGGRLTRPHGERLLSRSLSSRAFRTTVTRRCLPGAKPMCRSSSILTLSTALGSNRFSFRLSFPSVLFLQEYGFHFHFVLAIAETVSACLLMLKYCSKRLLKLTSRACECAEFSLPQLIPGSLGFPTKSIAANSIIVNTIMGDVVFSFSRFYES